MRAVTVVLLALLLAGCTSGGGDGNGSGNVDREKEARELDTARTRVLDELTPVLRDLTAALPGRLRFSQGNYDACENDLDGATAVTYRVNGRVDGSGGGDPTAAVRAALDGAGFEVAPTSDGPTVDATRGDTFATFSGLDGEDALLFSAYDTGCYAVGGDRATSYTAEKDPLKLG